MPESLPGDPTEAGPGTRPAKEQDDWNDRSEPDDDPIWSMMRSEEETSHARTRCGIRTTEDRRKLIEAIMRAESFLMSAKEALRAR